MCFEKSMQFTAPVFLSVKAIKNPTHICYTLKIKVASQPYPKKQEYLNLGKENKNKDSMTKC